MRILVQQWESHQLIAFEVLDLHPEKLQERRVKAGEHRPGLGIRGEVGA